jgi:glycosyltransferase involved in cell wall biosynthesis
MKSSKNNPLVSVIIPTKNSASTILRCLKSIRNQTYKNIEIIVVDNHSTDNTVKLVRKMADKVYIYGPERTNQVNYGIKKAKGKYVYYTGSDLTHDDTLIEEAQTSIEKQKADAVYLNVLTKIKNPNFWQRGRAIERQLYYKEPGVSAARFYKKEVFMKLGGFDESLGGISDDLEFQHRLNINGYKTIFIDASENNFNEYNSLSIIVKRSLYYGWQIRRYMDKYPSKTKKQYSIIREEYVRHWRILVANPLNLISFISYKSIQYFFGGIGLLLGRLSKDNKKIEKWLFKLNYGK